METTAASVQAEIQEACERPLPLAEVAAAISAGLGRVVPHDGYCLFGFDPISGAPSFHASCGGYRDRLRDCGRLGENEQLENDLHRFRDLARAALPVGLLGTDDRVERGSPRRHEIMPAAGFGAEMRVALAASGVLWGALVLLREQRRRPFTRADAQIAAHLGPVLTRTVRRLPVVEPWPQFSAADPPGVILLGPSNAVEAVSPHARRWLERIEGAAQAGLPPAVYGVASAARAAARNPAAPDPVCRLPAADGSWVVLHGSLLDADPAARVSVVLEAGSPRTVLPFLALRHGLTSRERDVLELVLAGGSTKQIARRLDLSPHTVNDHLKALFRKAGVSSRRQLMAGDSQRPPAPAPVPSGQPFVA